MDKKISTARIRKNLEDLKAFTATPGKGCTRMPFSKETRAAAEYLKAAMKDAGLDVVEDCVGNIIGTRKGKDSSLPVMKF